MKNLRERGETLLRRTEFAHQFCVCAKMPMVLMAFFDGRSRTFKESWIGHSDMLSNESGQEMIQTAENRLALWGAAVAIDPDFGKEGVSAEGSGNITSFMQTEDYIISIGAATSGVYPVIVFHRGSDADFAARKTLLRMGMAYVTHQLTEELYARSVWMETLVETAMQVLSIQFLVVTADGKVRFDSLQNRPSQTSTTDWMVCNKVLSLKSEGENTQMQEAIQAATSGEGRTSIVSVFASPGVPRLVVVTPLNVGDSTMALVLFESENTDHFKLREHFFNAYSLTRSESMIAHEILKGLSIAEAAEANNLSQATVRSYMKQVFAKTGTHRQSELISLYFSSILPVTFDLKLTPERHPN
ncbi:helix-turn-helix transcriptional regulator [Thalassovita sp.]|uniref:helix-turn-helix transcriptional regulator n=1 Tax=Thalassovita sp. TaxID=1979401 RepID=UPI0029DE6D58|nr:helix-turn-helix transcriptional regulator [Thalassovita sp.]